jgi:hypothetical protein
MMEAAMKMDDLGIGGTTILGNAHILVLLSGDLYFPSEKYTRTGELGDD